MMDCFLLCVKGQGHYDLEKLKRSKKFLRRARKSWLTLENFNTCDLNPLCLRMMPDIFILTLTLGQGQIGHRSLKYTWADKRNFFYSHSFTFYFKMIYIDSLT